MSLRNVLIIGATGTIGSHVLAAFLRHKEFFDSVSLLTSTKSYQDKQDKFKSLEKQGANVIVIQEFIDVKELTVAFEGIDVIISTVGFELLPLQKGFIDAAVAAGVKRFYPSEFGSDTSYGDNAKASLYARKVEVSEYLKEVAQRTSLTYTLFVNGCFAEFFAIVPILVNADLETHTIGYDDGKIKISTTTFKDVGEYTVASVLDPASSRNKTIMVSSHEVTYEQVKQMFEKIQRVEYTVQKVTVQDLEAEEKCLRESGNEMGAIYANLRANFLAGNAVNQRNDAHMYPNVQPSSIEEALAACIKS